MKTRMLIILLMVGFLCIPAQLRAQPSGGTDAENTVLTEETFELEITGDERAADKETQSESAQLDERQALQKLDLQNLYEDLQKLQQELQQGFETLNLQKEDLQQYKEQINQALEEAAKQYPQMRDAFQKSLDAFGNVADNMAKSGFFGGSNSRSSSNSSSSSSSSSNGNETMHGSVMMGGGMSGMMGGYGMGMGYGSGFGAVQKESVTRIYPLERPVKEVRELLRSLIDDHWGLVRIEGDERTNSLIVIAPQAEHQKVEAILQGITSMERNSLQNEELANVTCEIFVVEEGRGQMKPEFDGMKEFRLSFVTRNWDDVADVLKVYGPMFTGINRRNIGDREEIQLQGWVSGQSDLDEMIKELKSKFEDLSIISASTTPQPFQYTKPQPAAELPEKLQPIVRRFLGENAQVTASWFGSAAIPGQIKAQMDGVVMLLASEPMVDQKFLAHIELRTDADEEPSVMLLENTVRVQIGQPVFFSYTRREEDSSRRGAVILITHNSIEDMLGQQTGTFNSADSAPAATNPSSGAAFPAGSIPRPAAPAQIAPSSGNIPLSQPASPFK
jgi:hypothetical protein